MRDPFALFDPFGGGGRRGFNPASLFRLGDQGLFYDPADAATLFTDTGGAVNALPGQSIAMRMDKSRGMALGPEMASNGSFDADAQWSKGAGVTIGSGVISADGTTVGVLATNASGSAAVVGRSYRVTYTVTAVVAASGGVSVGIGGATGTARTTTGTFSEVVTATSTGQVVIYKRGASAWAGSIDNITVKEVLGNHSTQANGGPRPTYGIEPVGGRRNLLTYTEDLSNASWGKSNTVVVGQKVASTGNGMTKVAWTAASGQQHSVNRVSLPITMVVGQAFTATVDVDPAEMTTVQLHVNGTDIAYPLVNLITGAVISGGNGNTTVEKIGTICRIRMVCTATATSGYLIIWPNGTGTGAGDGVSGLWIGAAQLETGGISTPYQRVVSDYEVTEAGKRSLSYLLYDGLDDGMATSAIDFSASDEMTIVAAVRKLSDATGMIAELGSNHTFLGGWYLATTNAPPLAAQYAGHGARVGVAQDNANAPLSAAPVTGVVAVQHKISGGAPAKVRVNAGAWAYSTSTDFGGGNFGNYPIYTGRRFGGTLPFPGKEYGLIIINRLLSASELAQVEAYFATAAGVTL